MVKTMVVILLTVFVGIPVAVRAQVKAFPSAEGFGAQTVGGRGGRVIEVTNLNDSGSGSFRACAEATGKRTCVFRVGGTIQLTRPIDIHAAQSNLTIAGQTAPGGGIAIGPWPITIAHGVHDVIVRYVRLRQGYAVEPPDPNNNCGNLFVHGPDPGNAVSNVIIDHVSAAWACDDSVQGIGYVTGTTFQWMLVGEGYHSPVDGYGNSKSYILGGQVAQISAHHNLIVHSQARNPNMGRSVALDWRHNVIYNWDACIGNMELGGTNDHIQSTDSSNVNFVGNKYIAGPQSNTSDCWLGTLYTDSILRIYQTDNETPFCNGRTGNCAPDAWAIGWGDGETGLYQASESTYRVATPHSVPSVGRTPLADLESVLAQRAGATKPSRDALDARLVSEMQSRTGSLGRRGAPAPVLNSGTPPVDSDHDGMPDSWELSHGLNPNNGADGAATAANGYTNLENYLNELAGDTVPGGSEPGPIPAPVNLRARVSGF